MQRRGQNRTWLCDKILFYVAIFKCILKMLSSADLIVPDEGRER